MQRAIHFGRVDGLTDLNCRETMLLKSLNKINMAELAWINTYVCCYMYLYCMLYIYVADIKYLILGITRMTIFMKAKLKKSGRQTNILRNKEWLYRKYYRK